MGEMRSSVHGMFASGRKVVDSPVPPPEWGLPLLLSTPDIAAVKTASVSPAVEVGTPTVRPGPPPTRGICVDYQILLPHTPNQI